MFNRFNSFRVLRVQGQVLDITGTNPRPRGLPPWADDSPVPPSGEDTSPQKLLLSVQCKDTAWPDFVRLTRQTHKSVHLIVRIEQCSNINQFLKLVDGSRQFDVTIRERKPSKRKSPLYKAALLLRKKRALQQKKLHMESSQSECTQTASHRDVI